MPDFGPIMGCLSNRHYPKPNAFVFEFLILKAHSRLKQGPFFEGGIFWVLGGAWGLLGARGQLGGVE